MPNIYNISSKEVLTIAQRQGYVFSRQTGSHLIFRNQKGKVLVIPNHKKLKIGTLLQIIKVLGMTKEEFLKQL